MSSTRGLRERKKAETRLAVHRAALRLATERGFDGITVEEIADAARVSRRTFFNYFADKAEAVVFGEEDLWRRLIELMDEQPAALSGWRALRAASELLLAPLAEPDREWVARSKLARRHPCLLARLLANQAVLERDLARRIRERDGGSRVHARVLAAGYLSAIRAAGHVWFDTDDDTPLFTLIEAALDELALPYE
ncbi:TetR/AcrR family transcriptional regulator [Actinocorallia sp. API 0066]|uniref:TetR/AcrR family transcriptional regulator n=1 Tax=Actinocorallia sp. API 0066 TaxID=2896846 RepID=UPI001E36B393|nr:TetR family transcriptional regulator [Actinocorallia sp. API 0066]MCD0449753.1 TetR/AcrR family transcriptional regulator [Actinocorallia sp. API 0066]